MGNGYKSLKQICTVKHEWVFEKMIRDGKRRNYSPRTIETYNHALTKFFGIYNIDPRKITTKNIESYIDQLILWNKSYNTINVHVSAIKYFYGNVLNKKCAVRIPIAKQQKRLPTYLEKNEIVKLLSVIHNNKHYLMISLLYSSGMRVSELLNLKIKDLDLIHLQGWIRQGKGNKDRPFIIAQSIQTQIKEYVQNKNKSEYLFSNKGNKMSASTIRVILKKAAKKSNLQKHVHPHTLRHSFATHLAQNGYAATDIQPILGHKDIETTMIYTHIANLKLLNIESPLDSLTN